jgi:hypothetical protein
MQTQTRNKFSTTPNSSESGSRAGAGGSGTSAGAGSGAGSGSGSGSAPRSGWSLLKTILSRVNVGAGILIWCGVIYYFSDSFTFPNKLHDKIAKKIDATNLKSRKQQLEELKQKDKIFDILIIGGG